MHREQKERMYWIEVRTGQMNLDGSVSYPRKDADQGKYFAVVVHGHTKIFFFNIAGQEMSVDDF